MRLLVIGLLITGCSSNSAGPKLDCAAFANKAATGIIGASRLTVSEAAQSDCERGAIKQPAFDCVMAAKTADEVTVCLKH